MSKASGGSALGLPPWPLRRPQPLPCRDSNPDGAPTAGGWGVQACARPLTALNGEGALCLAGMPTDRRLCCFRPSVSVACGGGPEFTVSSVPWPAALRRPVARRLPLAASRTLTIFPRRLGRELPGSEGPWALLPGPPGLGGESPRGARAWLPWVLVGSEPSQAQGVCVWRGRWERQEGSWSPPLWSCLPHPATAGSSREQNCAGALARRTQTQGRPPASAPQILPARLGVRPGGNTVAPVKPSHLQREGVPSPPRPPA